MTTLMTIKTTCDNNEQTAIMKSKNDNDKDNK